MPCELSIIIPAFNEQSRLPSTIERIFKSLAGNNYQDFEVVVANDGSTDNTAQVIEDLSKQYSKLKLLDYKRNRGRGAVCKDAVFETRGDFILITDADGSTSSEFIVPFVKYLKEHEEVDILVGSRDMEGAKIINPQPAFRVFLNKIFLLMARLLFGWPMHDRVNGFKMFKRAAALDIYPHQTETSFFAEAELVFIAEQRGWRVRELPIEWRDDRDSRMRPVREALRSFWGMFRIALRGRRGFYN